MDKKGTVRKIDNVGRIVIPKELRLKHNIECGDMVEIFINQNNICLKKYGTETDVMDQAETLYEVVEQMEQDLKAAQELEEYLKRIRSKLEQLQNK